MTRGHWLRSSLIPHCPPTYTQTTHIIVLNERRCATFVQIRVVTRPDTSYTGRALHPQQPRKPSRDWEAARKEAIAEKAQVDLPKAHCRCIAHLRLLQSQTTRAAGSIVILGRVSARKETHRCSTLERSPASGATAVPAAAG